MSPTRWLSASGSQAWTIPPGYRQDITKGVFGRAARTRPRQKLQRVYWTLGNLLLFGAKVTQGTSAVTDAAISGAGSRVP